MMLSGRLVVLPRSWRGAGRRFFDPSGCPGKILTQLQARAEAENLITWDFNVDSTVCRAHQHARRSEEKKGTCKRNRPAASSPSPRTMGSVAPGAV